MHIGCLSFDSACRPHDEFSSLHNRDLVGSVEDEADEYEISIGIKLEPFTDPDC
jgi:hypothetical protein